MSLRSIMTLLLRLHGWTSPVGSVLVTALVPFPLTAYRHHGDSKGNYTNFTYFTASKLIWAGIFFVNFAILEPRVGRARVSANVGFKACIHVQRRLFCRRMGWFLVVDAIGSFFWQGVWTDIECAACMICCALVCNLPFFGLLAIYWPRACL